jgi:hypothetical protein
VYRRRNRPRRHGLPVAASSFLSRTPAISRPPFWDQVSYEQDHAVAPVLLSRLGYPDAAVDRLLARALVMGADFGPERVHHRRPKREWPARVWPVGEARSHFNRSRKFSRLLAESMLGRPVDALGSSRLDFYAFTRAVMYASDLGRTQVALPRRSSDIASDAIAALAFSLDGDDFDLTAEVLSSWPMLRLAWSPCASFAFQVLANVQDELGFLPGFDSIVQAMTACKERSACAMCSPRRTTRYVLWGFCQRPRLYQAVDPRHRCDRSNVAAREAPRC